MGHSWYFAVTKINPDPNISGNLDSLRQLWPQKFFSSLIIFSAQFCETFSTTGQQTRLKRMQWCLKALQFVVALIFATLCLSRWIFTTSPPHINRYEFVMTSKSVTEGHWNFVSSIYIALYDYKKWACVQLPNIDIER